MSVEGSSTVVPGPGPLDGLSARVVPVTGDLSPPDPLLSTELVGGDAEGTV